MNAANPATSWGQIILLVLVVLCIRWFYRWLGADAPARLYETFVPRSQFQHYVRITEGEALTLYPDLSR